MLSALDRKLFRDLSQMKGQSFAIAIVIAAGVATFVNSRTIVNSLELTRSTFYERHRFADLFAKVKRAARCPYRSPRRNPRRRPSGNAHRRASHARCARP